MNARDTAAERDIAFRIGAPRRDRRPLTAAVTMLAVAATLNFGALAMQPDMPTPHLAARLAFGMALLGIAVALLLGDHLYQREDRHDRRQQAIKDHLRFEADFDAHLRPILTPGDATDYRANN